MKFEHRIEKNLFLVVKLKVISFKILAQVSKYVDHYYNHLNCHSTVKALS